MTVDDSVRKKALELTKRATLHREGAAALRFRGAECALREHFPWGGALSAACSLGGFAEWVRRLQGQTHAAFRAAAGGRIQSYPVLIGRARKLDVDVPSPAQFDHVITAARLGTGTGLTWLDTTPEVTPFG